MCKVSVIIPVYNSQNTLSKCVNSVIDQTLDDIEIIIIDDGSTDKSPEICDAFTYLNDNIKVIHKKNEGLGKAYNQGLKIAKGKYIGFVESDDHIEKNMYEILYKEALLKDSDIVKCHFDNYSSLNAKTQPTLEKTLAKEIALLNQPFNIFEYKKLLFYHSSIWTGLYKSEFIKKFKFSITPSASYQDFSFAIDILTSAKRISMVNNILYHWNVQNDQSSVAQTNERLIQILNQAIIAKNILIKKGCFEDLLPHFYKQVMISNFTFYRNIKLKYKKLYFDKLREFFSDINLDNINKITLYLSAEELKLLLFIIANDYQGSLIFSRK